MYIKVVLSVSSGEVSDIDVDLSNTHRLAVMLPVISEAECVWLLNA